MTGFVAQGHLNIDATVLCWQQFVLNMSSMWIFVSILSKRSKGLTVAIFSQSILSRGHCTCYTISQASR